MIFYNSRLSNDVGLESPTYRTFKHWCGAFTLAEVLITLGIIGIVAAMTMPSLIQSYRKQEASARLKKFNSIFNQMMIMSEEDNGPSSEWERSGDIQDENGNLDWNANFSEQRRFFEKYFAKYIKYVKIEDGSIENDENNNVVPKAQVAIYFGDGSRAHFYNGGAFSFVYDVNGSKPPNVAGRDQFVWDIWPSETAGYYYPEGHNYGTRRMMWDRNNMTRSQYLNFCKNNGTVYCARLLELDNWEFKKDYPYRI